MELTRQEVNDASGNGNGYGYGYGYGNGYGNGYGYGYGNGYGNGNGYDGYGYGNGYDGDKDVYFAALLAPFRRGTRTIAFWRSTKEGSPANGGRGTIAKVGLVEEIKGPLKICTENALHATSKPELWQGERWWIVALDGNVQTQEDKFGALKREFLADLGRCPF
jgi:hypothetical protein